MLWLGCWLKLSGIKGLLQVKIMMHSFVVYNQLVLVCFECFNAIIQLQITAT